MCFLCRGIHITRDMCFLGRETPITRDMGFLCRGTHHLMCVSRVGEHISQGGMCFIGRGTHNYTRNMCFPGRGTRITRDMCFIGRGTHTAVSVGIYVSWVGEHIRVSLGICVPG